MSTQQTQEHGDIKKFPTPLLLDEEYGTEIPAPDICFDPKDLYAGNVLTLKNEGGKRHYLIKRVENGDPKRVYVSPGKSTLRKGLLLLVILAGMWFVIDYAVGYLFG